MNSQGSPGVPRSAQESPGFPRTPQESPGIPRSPQEIPGSAPRNSQVMSGCLNFRKLSSTRARFKEPPQNSLKKTPRDS